MDYWLNTAITVFFAIVAAAVPPLCLAAIRLFTKKTNIIVSEDSAVWLQTKAAEAVRYAEEQARNAAYRLTGPDKKELARGYMQAEAIASGRAVPTDARADRAIESTLNSLRPEIKAAAEAAESAEATSPLRPRSVLPNE